MRSFPCLSLNCLSNLLVAGALYAYTRTLLLIECLTHLIGRWKIAKRSNVFRIYGVKYMKWCQCNAYMTSNACIYINVCIYDVKIPWTSLRSGIIWALHWPYSGPQWSAYTPLGNVTILVAADWLSLTATTCFRDSETYLALVAGRTSFIIRDSHMGYSHVLCCYPK